MKTILSIAILFVSATTCSFSQNKFGKVELTISLPFVWNKVEVTNLIGSGMYTPRNPNGQGWSGGLNATFQWHISNGFFLSGGLGYYQQNFFIHRPFNYSTPLFPLFTTKEYNYQNIQWIIGAGYNLSLNKLYSIRGVVTYNQFNSFRQVYYPESTAFPKQVNSKDYRFGSSVIFSLGVYRKIHHKILLGANVLVPTSMKWRKDLIFAEDPTEFHDSKSSFGFGISGVCQF